MANYPRGQHEYRSPFGDTTYTKVFVGGLAWETQTEKMRAYFEQFGEILEAVIICDKHTGKSKGYGFVTFRDPAAASRACENPNPFIDGRKANCNIASFGRPKPSPPRGRNTRGIAQGQSSSSSSSYSGMPTPQHATLPHQFYYPPYGYSYTSYPYQQGVYNPQIQASQYYAAAQLYGGGGGSSPTSSLGLGSSPYYYGYPTTGAGGVGFSPSALSPHRMTTGPSFLYYPTTQIEGGPLSPYPNPALHPALSSPSASAPPPIVEPTTTTTTTKQAVHIPSSSSKGDEAQEAPQSTSTETDAVVISTEAPSPSA